MESYTDFFKALPVDLGMAFVLIQHLDPTHHSLLAEIIAKATKMPVEEVKSGVEIEANRVYVIPPGRLMALTEGKFALTPRSKVAREPLVINFFMHSLAEERGSKAIGVLLSGTGFDGTLGLGDIKTQGGLTFVQAPATAKFDSMPRSAIEAGNADFILAPEEIAWELQRVTRHLYVSQQANATDLEPTSVSGQDLAAILEELNRASGVDFSQYKPNTLQRRALRRMAILKLDSMRKYAKHLKQSPDEALKLYDDVLIPVTSFFRDFEAFEVLKRDVYPAIVKDQSNKGSIRMWAPGCSTGEETYSLAMTLLEFLGDNASNYQIQIFGTDLNEKGIQKARAGIYRESIAEEISPERLRRFFVKVDEGYRVSKAVRDLCVFARQNLANDPPFSQMNVVACRNLLIYVQPSLQKQIIPILHYALKPSGFLVLGGSESVASFPELFSAVDKKHKIFAKKAIASRLHYNFSQNYYPAARGANQSAKAVAFQPASQPDVDVQVEADRLVLKEFAPVGVVINNEMEVIQFRGRTSPYLEPAPGKASLNVLKLARGGLGMELRTLINAARRKGVTTRKEGVVFDADGSKRLLKLSVSPLADQRPTAGNMHFLILFEDAVFVGIAGSEAVNRKGKGSAATKQSARLKQELVDAQEALRIAVESEDALKEGFQSANEEILSANEELQSTNEELETSKEELQSTNEELNTLNEELRNKNIELHVLNNDLFNFLNSTQIPIVMLDSHSRIRRLTPNANRLLKVVPTDIGRPISDIRLNIKLVDLEAIISRTLESLQPQQRDVQDSRDRWHSLHILPYRTEDNKIDGTVLILQDIDAAKQASEQLRKSNDFFRGIINTVREPLLVLDADLRVIAANEPYLLTFKVSAAETAGKFLYRVGNAQWNIPRLRALLEQVLPEQQMVRDFEVSHVFESIGRKTMLLNARTLVHTDGQQPMILLAIQDITESRLAEAALIKSEKLAAAGRLAGSLAHEINNPLQAVTNLMTLLGGSSKLDEQDQRYATLAKNELGRVIHLVRQSLGFYRETSLPTTANLEDVLESVIDLYKHKLNQLQIILTKEYRNGMIVKTYPSEIRQMFSTLLQNAMEACETGCRITLRARIGSDWRRPEIRGVRITVADSGHGISDNKKARIFEPFFTTKGEQGTGLGLWVTQGVAQRLGGSINMRSRSEPGKSGTCFSIFLPEQD